MVNIIFHCFIKFSSISSTMAGVSKKGGICNLKMCFLKLFIVNQAFPIAGSFSSKLCADGVHVQSEMNILFTIGGHRMRDGDHLLTIHSSYTEKAATNLFNFNSEPKLLKLRLVSSYPRAFRLHVS